MLDNDLDKEIRKRQARIIQETAGSFSFSKCLNQILRKQLK